MEEIVLTHNSHPDHELRLKNYQKPYKCDGCKEQGSGLRYRCEICNYDLHQDCVFASSTASHTFFKNCTFKFLNQLSPNCTCKDCLRYCDACVKPVYGFVYHCKDKGWDLHPCCLNLKDELLVDDIKFQLRNGNVSSNCIWCNRRKIKKSQETRIPGWSYVSKCKNYHFHVHCTAEMVEEVWKMGGTNKENKCMDLENFELPVQVLKRNRGKRNKDLRIVKMFLKTIASILLVLPKNFHFHVHRMAEKVMEVWKSGGNNMENDKCLDLENIELQVQVWRRNRREGDKYLRILKTHLKTIA